MRSALYAAHACSAPLCDSRGSGNLCGGYEWAGQPGRQLRQACGAAEQVFQWVSYAFGTATVETCGAGTDYDSVLYVRRGSCTNGVQVACQ